MKRVIVVSALIATILFARGTSGGYGCFGPSVALIDYEKINEIFTRNGVTKLSSQHWLFGGGGYLLANRVLIGGAGWGGTQSVTSESLNLFCEVNYGGGEFRTGYAVVDLKHLLIIPGIGIGGGGYSITLGPDNQTVPNFDSLLKNPGRTSTVNFSGFNINPQITFVIPISFVGVEIRAGYNLGPLGGKWEFADRGNLARGPEMAKTNPWLSFNLLFGGFSRQKKGAFKGKMELQIPTPEEETKPKEEQEE